MAIKNKYLANIVHDYTTSPKSRTWKKMRPRAQVAHDTGNPGSTAKGNSNYMKSTTKVVSGAHTFIDDKEIRIVIPLDEKAYHVQYNKPLDNQIWGDDANDIALGHELCYGPGINFEKAYDKFVWMHAYCARTFGIPLSKIEGHYKLDPQRRTDPINSFKQNGKTWAGFLADVKAYYDAWHSDSAKPSTVAPGHLDELVHTIVKGDTLWSIAREHETNIARLKALNPGIDEKALQIGSKITVKTVKEDTKPEPILVDDPQPEKAAFIGKRVESIVASLNFYDGPRWNNPSGQVSKGMGFPTIVDKVTVDGAEQYKVKNSKGQTFYITANPKYVKVEGSAKPVAPADPYAGKKLRSKVASLNFYDTPRWDAPSGQVQKGWGFPTIVKKVNTDGSDQYQVKNSKGHTYYITANPKYVEIVNE